MKISDYAAANLSGELNPNLVFALADQIFSAIERGKGTHVRMPDAAVIERICPQEAAIGKGAAK